jgi:hypothetical protein
MSEITITYPDHSGNRHKMVFASTIEALAYLREMERIDAIPIRGYPGRIESDRFHKISAFRKALGIQRP